MPRHVAQRVVGLLANSPRIETVDITGGAPELNPYFRFLVEQSRRLGKHVIDRSNLTVFFEPGMESSFLTCLPMWHKDRYAAELLSPAVVRFTAPGVRQASSGQRIPERVSAHGR